LACEGAIYHNSKRNKKKKKKGKKIASVITVLQLQASLC